MTLIQYRVITIIVINFTYIFTISSSDIEFDLELITGFSFIRYQINLIDNEN